MGTRYLGRRADWRWLVLAVAMAAALALGLQQLWADETLPQGDGPFRPTLRHLDVDPAAEDAADGSSIGNPEGVLTIQDDPDDATGSEHVVCILDEEYSGEADSDNITWHIVRTANSDATVHVAPSGTKFVQDVPYDTTAPFTDIFEDAPCVRWRSGGLGGQMVTATYGDPEDTRYAVFTFDEAGAPIVKEWNSIDDTTIVAVDGTLGSDIFSNTGELSQWSSRDTSFWQRQNLDQQTIDVISFIIPGGPRAGNIASISLSFIEYALGSHADYDGPIDGVEQTFTLNPPGSGGTCGSVRIEDPVSGAIDPLIFNGSFITLESNSDKGVGFQVFASDDAQEVNLLNADCRPGDKTVIKISSQERTQLNSIRDTAPDEYIAIRWVVELPPEKVPLLPWAGTRQPVQHNWLVGPHEDPNSPIPPFPSLCPSDIGTGLYDPAGWAQPVEEYIIAVRYIRTGGPGGFIGNEALAIPGLPNTEDQVVVWLDEDCNSTAIYESEDQGEADIEMELVAVYVGEEGPPVIIGASPSKVAIPLFYLKLEDLTLGAVAGMRYGHACPLEEPDGAEYKFSNCFWTPANPYLGAPQDADVTTDTEYVEANVSEDVLIRARVRGWFVNSNPSGREQETKEDVFGTTYVVPENRWVLPDDWEELAGGPGLAEIVRPHWDINIEPNGIFLCLDPFGPCGVFVEEGGTKDFIRLAFEPVAGPYTPLDPSFALVFINGLLGTVVEFDPTFAPFFECIGAEGVEAQLILQSCYYQSVVPDFDVDWWDAPMQPAQLTFHLVDETGTDGRPDAGGFKPADKSEIYYVEDPDDFETGVGSDVEFTNPFYATHIPATFHISALAVGGGFLWDTWGNCFEDYGERGGETCDGLYYFWDSALVNQIPVSGQGVTYGTDPERPDSVVVRTHTIYTDNHGEGMTYINGDEIQSLLTYDECADNAFTGTPHCEPGELVGTTSLTAFVDYPDFRKHPPIRALNQIDIDWTWGGYKEVRVYRTLPDGTELHPSRREVVIHLRDRDGFCGGSPSLHPVENELITWTLDAGEGVFLTGEQNYTPVANPPGGGTSVTTTTFDVDANPAISYPKLSEGYECQSWVIVQNSLLSEADIFVLADDPEGPIGFDVILFVDQADLQVTKVASQDEAHHGDTITYTVTVRNVGELVVEGIALQDDLIDEESLTCSVDLPATLGQNQEFTCTYDYTVPEDGEDEDPLVNTVTVTGTAFPDDEEPIPVEETASETVDILHPDLTVQKQGPSIALASTTVTYTFIVTNSGDATLNDVTVEDDVLGSLEGCNVATLAAGAQLVCSAQYTVPAELEGTTVTNIVTVIATDNLGQPVGAQDTHETDVIGLEFPLYEGWNEVHPWLGATIHGIDNVIDALNGAVDPNVWTAVANFNNATQTWTQAFKSAPLPSFNTLVSVEAGKIYWIFVTADATLTFPLQ